MKKLRICSVLLIGLMFLGGTAFAFSPADHVKVAPNGKGDLIFFPWYYTDTDGWQTKLTIINTSDTYNTVAKVVVRSYNWSEELVDFLIYLSPNDVWTGVLISKRDGTYIESTDDSCLYKYPANNTAVAADFASTTDPARKFSSILFDTSCAGDATNLGYVEVIEAATTTSSLGDLKKVSGKVAKENIYNWYKSFSDKGGITSDCLPQNILTGYYEWSNSMGSGYAATSRGEIFADWGNYTYLDLTGNTGINSNSNNTIGELEAAMAKRDVSLPYANKTNGDVAVHVFNFPTKLSTLNRTEDEKLGCVYKGYVNSPYFALNAKCETYTNSIYDLLENTPATSGSIVSGGTTDSPEMCNEVEMLVTNYTSTVFSEGWVRYNWNRTPTDKDFRTVSVVNSGLYSGTPVLPVTVLFNSSSVTIAADAHTDGDVYEGTELLIPWLPYYQYTNIYR